MPDIPRIPESTRHQTGGGRSGRRGGLIPSAAIAVAAVLGVYLIHDGTRTGGPPRPAAVDAPTAGRPSAVASSSTPPAALPYAAPSRISIPSIRVNAPVTGVGLDQDGSVGAPPPQDKNLAGWYTPGPAPGQTGTAVVDGHVDNTAGPAVFYNLGVLHKDDRIEVSRTDGRTAVFTIYGIELFAKDDFPAKRVYGDTGRPELRVITCGGAFTKKNGYAGNVVVFARLSAVR